MKTILLLHGWGISFYYGRTDKPTWHYKLNFINEMKKLFDVHLIDMPGFGLTPPPESKKWELDDFADYLENYLNKNNIKLDYLLGHSFGGPVAIRWKTKYKNKTKLILDCPAIIRNYGNSKSFTKTPAFLDPIREMLRELYLIYITKTPEMVHGSKFHRKTYQRIVREELLDELLLINPKDLIIIYGREDDMVDPKRAFDYMSEKYKRRVKFIENGGHEIAVTHTEEVMSVIKEFIK